MKSLARVFIILCMSGTLASCISFNIRVPPPSQPQRPAPSVPEVIPSPSGTPTTPPPITDLNSPASGVPTTVVPTTTTTTEVDSSPAPTSNVIPVGKSISNINNPPPLKKKPSPTGAGVLTQPNMQ